MLKPILKPNIIINSGIPRILYFIAEPKFKLIISLKLLVSPQPGHRISNSFLNRHSNGIRPLTTI